MPFITREDGERFIIPSYRDVLNVQKASLLKKEILLLSTNYGEYITLQKKSSTQYEVAFSPDPGYLLGECVWQYFKRPKDMIYCEAIPNTSEAILVIVKNGSVYLDGSFPVDSIVEELIVFKTQQNAFNIFIYGDVPISQQPEDGKLSFDSNSVVAFTELEQPVFPTLPGVKAFQLQLVDTVLRAQGIGIVPTKKIATGVAVALVLLLGYHYLTRPEEISVPVAIAPPTNPFQSYIDQLSTVAPASQLLNLYQQITKVFSLSGWAATSFEYTPGLPAVTRVSLQSLGGKMSLVLDWAKKNNADVEFSNTGVFITLKSVASQRSAPDYINQTNEIVATLVDRLSYVIQGKSIDISTTASKKNYYEIGIKITIPNMSPDTLVTIANVISGLPLVLDKVKLEQSGYSISGEINLRALGN